jgi:hydrogenase maturation protease
MLKIVCIGNCFHESDNLGYGVFNFLLKYGVPKNVKLVYGGLAGLDLAIHLKDAVRVVFVDSLSGFSQTDKVLTLDYETVSSHADSFGHSSGLPYLFYMSRYIFDGCLPDMFVVGAECNLANVKLVAEKALEAVLNGRR